MWGGGDQDNMTIFKLEKYCHSPTQPQHELELDLIMGRNPTPQELLRHFQATQEADFLVCNLILTQLERRPPKKNGK